MELKDILQIGSYVASIVSALTAIIAAIFISRQIANIRRNREVDTLFKIIALSDDKKTREAKEWMIYELNHGLTIQQLKTDKDSLAKFSQLVHLFETMGVLVNQGYIPKELVFDKYGLFIAGAWGKLHAIIVAQRIDSDTEEFAENFQLMVMQYDSWACKIPLKVAKGERVRVKAAKDYLNRGIGQ